MNGVMIAGVSAGSNQVGASEMCTPQVSCPSGAAARFRQAPRLTASRAAASADQVRAGSGQTDHHLRRVSSP